MISITPFRHTYPGFGLGLLGTTVLALLAAPSPAQVVPTVPGGATMVYNVVNYGATPNDSTDDDRLAIQNAIRTALTYSGDTEIYFPPGQYHIVQEDSTDTSVLSMTGNENGPNPTSVHIRSSPGGMAELVIRPEVPEAFNVGCLDIRDLSNVSVKQLKIDYRNDLGKPTTFTQGTVRAMGLGVPGQPDSGYLYLEVDSGYLGPKLLSQRTYAIDPDTGGFRAGVANRLITTITQVGNTSVYRMEHEGISSSNDNLQLGDRVAFPDTPTGSAALFVEDVDGITISDVEINAGGQMGVMVRDCKDTQIDNVRIIPGAPADPTDPVRMISTNRDGIHISDSRGSLSVTNSTTKNTNDDGVTSHGFSFGLTAIHAPKRIRLTKGSSHQADPEIDDQLRFYDMSSTTYMTRTIQTVAAAGVDAFDIGLTAITYPTTPVDLTKVYVSNLETVGSNILISGNHCEGNAGRGIMIWGSNGTIDNNTCLHTEMAGIQVQTYLRADTWDSCASQGVVITNNEIRHAGEGKSRKNFPRGGLSIYNQTVPSDAPGMEPQNWPSADLFSDILIENNLFENVHGPNIIISNATNVQIINNNFDSVNVHPGGENHSDHNRDLLVTAVVDLEYVDQISFVGNTITNTDVTTFVTPDGAVNKFVGFGEDCGVIYPTLYPIPPTPGSPIPMPDMGFTVIP